MKIYINNFNVTIINNIANKFKTNLVKTYTYIHLYTNEGIYMIDNKNTYLVTITDKDIKIYNNYYNNISFIVDSSIYDKNKVTSINGNDHLSFQIHKYIYKINTSSVVQMIIEYSNKIPNDIYFEINKDVDINDDLIKKEIIEFLSGLN